MARVGNVYRSLVGKITGETEKAVRFQIDVSSEANEYPIYKNEWFPRSQLSSVHVSKTPDGDVIMASEWILGQKGWLDYAGAAGYNPAISTVVQNQVVPQQLSPAAQKFKDSLSDKLKTPPAPSFVDMDDDIPF